MFSSYIHKSHYITYIFQFHDYIFVFSQIHSKKKMSSLISSFNVSFIINLPLVFIFIFFFSSPQQYFGMIAAVNSETTAVIGTFEFKMNTNPGYLRVRPYFLSNTIIVEETEPSIPTNSSISPNENENHDFASDALENNNNIPFGGVCSFLLDPVTSFFFEPQQYAVADRVANLFCTRLFNSSSVPNETHTNFFFTETVNTTEDPRPTESYLRNVDCSKEFVCKPNVQNQSVDTVANSSASSFFEVVDFLKCSYEFFYRSPVYAAINENPTESNPVPLPCVFGNIAGLHCMARRPTTTSTTSTTNTASTIELTSTSTTTSSVDLETNTTSTTEENVTIITTDAVSLSSTTTTNTIATETNDSSSTNISTTITSSSTTTTTATTIIPSPEDLAEVANITNATTDLVPLNNNSINNNSRSSNIFTSEGLQISNEWFVRLNRSANNRLEVRRQKNNNNNNSNNNSNEPVVWGVVCDSTWNNDIARMFCNDFFGFTSKNASVFKANPPTSPNFDPNALMMMMIVDSNGTQQIKELPFLWGPAPSCSGCANGDLGSKYCEVRDFLVEECVVGDEIGLHCQNDDDDDDENNQNDNNNNNNVTNEHHTVVTIQNGGYEWRLNESNGGLVEIRPLVQKSTETSSSSSSSSSPLPFGFIQYTSNDQVTSDTICRWFGYAAGGNARTPQDVETNFLSAIPPLDRQPCYLSWIKCFTRASPSLAYCIFNTNSAEHCGGSQYAQYLNCSHPFPSKTRTMSLSVSLTNTSSITFYNQTTPDATEETFSSSSLFPTTVITTSTSTVNPSITAPITSTESPITTFSPPQVTTTMTMMTMMTSTTTTSNNNPPSPPRDPGGVLDFSSSSLTRGGTSVIGVGLGIGFAFLAVIIIFLVFALRNKEVVVDCLEGIRSAEEHEIEDARQDERIQEQLREERKYRSSSGEGENNNENDDGDFMMEMTPKESLRSSNNNNNNNNTNNNSLKTPLSSEAAVAVESSQNEASFTPRNNENDEEDIK